MKTSRPRKPIDVLFENERCVVFYKPAGLLVTPVQKKETERTLTSVVNDQFEGKIADSMRLHPCHRLDKETTGAILFAKGKKNQQLLMDIFKAQKIRKVYLAFVHGQLDRLDGVIKRPIRDKFERKFRQNTPGQTAKTKYHVLQEFGDFTVVEAEILTGRTHQIRIHFAQIEHPVVGESQYAFRRDFPLKFKRTALHAYRLSWQDPITREKIKVEASVPTDMNNFLQKHQVKG